MNTSSTAGLVLSTLVFSASPLQAQSAWVVDDDGGNGVDFTTITEAVAAAADGDLILVESGTYNELLTIQGKGLSIVADAGAAVSLTGIDFFGANDSAGVLIEDLGPTQSVLLRGLNLLGSGYIQGHHVRVRNNQGPVWFEDCTITPSLLGGQEGLEAESSLNVTLVRCTLDPVRGAACTNPGSVDCGNALVVNGSSVHVFDCVIAGADGDGIFGQITRAAAGIVVLGGSLYVSGGSVVGGDGALNTGFCPKGDGAPGIVLAGAGAIVRFLEAGYAGGAGAPGAGDGCADGLDGDPLLDLGGDVLIELDGDTRRFDVGSPRRAGEDVVLSYGGLPGDAVYLGFNAGPAGYGFYLPALRGTVLTIGTSAPTIQFQGTLDASGLLTVTLPGPSISVAGEFDAYVSQPLFVGQDGFTVGDPSQLTLLDASL